MTHETSNKLINNVTNYKLWDQNIKDILDAFNNNDNRDKIVSEQIGFFEDLINDIAKISDFKGICLVLF